MNIWCLRQHPEWPRFQSPWYPVGDAADPMDIGRRAVLVRLLAAAHLRGQLADEPPVFTTPFSGIGAAEKAADCLAGAAPGAIGLPAAV